MSNSNTSNVVGLVFGGAGLTCLVASLRNPAMEGRNIGIGLGTLFLVLGLVFLIAGFSAIAHRRKFGSASLRVTKPAAIIGSRLAGVLEVPKGIRRDDRFKFRLTCTRITHTPGSGANRRNSESREPLWIGEEILHPTSSRPDGSMELPFTFTIPAGLPGSWEDYPRIEWQIDITAAVSGLDFRESFPVTVSEKTEPETFAPNESDPQIRAASNHRTGSSPFQPQPDWSAGRIEADRRVGPIWPGMTGIGFVPLQFAGVLASAPKVAGLVRRIISALIMFVVIGSMGSMFFQGHGLQFLESLPETIFNLLDGSIWFATALGGVLALTAGLTIWHRSWHLQRFGISFLRLETLPVRAGTPMKGILEIPRSVVPKNGFSFRLLRARTRWFGGRFFGPAAQTGWTGEWTTFQGNEPRGESTEVPFVLPVPSELPEFDNDEIPWQWYVEVSAPVPGLDYIARFVVPVQHVR